MNMVRAENAVNKRLIRATLTRHHKPRRRILSELVIAGIEHSMHATKGMRAVRVPVGRLFFGFSASAPVVIERNDAAHIAAAQAKRAARNINRAFIWTGARA